MVTRQNIALNNHSAAASWRRVRTYARSLLIALVLVLFTPLYAFAQPSLRSEVTPQSGSMEDLFIFTVVLEGAQEEAQLQLSTSSDFTVQFLGPRTAKSIINGIVRVQQSFVYQLSPRRAGTLHTPEVQAMISGQQLSAAPVAVLIRGQDSASAAPSGRGREPIFMNQTASPSSVYVGQQIVNSIVVYTKINVQGIKIDDSAADGFWQEVISDGSNSRKTINGEDYIAAGISRALFPLKAGALSIPKRTAIAKVLSVSRTNPLSGLDPFSDDFFENFFKRSIVQDKKLTSQELTVEAKQLPAAPKELLTALGPITIVGSTTLKLHYSDAPMKVGEIKNVSVIVTSEGNLNPLKSVPLNVPSGVKAYDGQTQTKHDTQGYKLLTEKTFSFSIVPLQPGVVHIPGASLAFFDPQSESYKLSTTPDLSLIVTGSPQGTPITQSSGVDQQSGSSTATKPSDFNPVPTLAQAPFAPPLSYQERSLWESLSSRLSLQLSLLILSATIGITFLASLALKAIAAKSPTRKISAQVSSAATLGEFEQSLRAWAASVLPGAGAHATYDELRSLIKTRSTSSNPRSMLLTLLDDVELARYSTNQDAVNLAELQQRFARIIREW